jgi:hypothetical protein
MLQENPFEGEINLDKFSNSVYAYYHPKKLISRIEYIKQGDKHQLIWFIDPAYMSSDYKENTYFICYHKQNCVNIYPETDILLTIEDNKYKLDNKAIDILYKKLNKAQCENKKFYIIAKNSLKYRSIIKHYIIAIRKYFNINKYLQNVLPQDIVYYISKFIEFPMCFKEEKLVFDIKNEKYHLEQTDEAIVLSYPKFPEIINKFNMDELIGDQLEHEIPYEGVFFIKEKVIDNFKFKVKKFVLYF